jgi:hypothetical protein
MPFKTEERITDLRRTVIVGGTCDGCGVELIFVGSEESSLVDGGMVLTLSGGYGMFFDDHAITAILCRNCSTKLLETFPGLQKAREAQETW